MRQVNVQGVRACLVILFLAFGVFAASASAATTASVTWPSKWRSPLGSSAVGTKVTMTTKWGAYSLGCSNADRTHGYTYYLPSGRAQHLGIDLAAPASSPVYSIADGMITNAGALWGASSYGVVLAQHSATNGNRFVAAYGHLTIGKNPRTKAPWVAGDMIKRGEVIGKVKTSGTGPHLHFGALPSSSAVTSVPGTATSSGSGICTSQPTGTTDPFAFLNARSAAPLSGSIVGYKNTNGSITSWRVVTVGSVLRRNWIPTTSIYSCLKSRGAVDWGARPSRFLSQIADVRGTHARCP